MGKEIFYERTFYVYNQISKFVNINGIEQKQIVSINLKGISYFKNVSTNDSVRNITLEGSGGLTTMFFYYSGDLKYDLGSELRNVKNTRTKIYSELEIFFFPVGDTKDDLSDEEFASFILKLNS